MANDEMSKSSFCHHTSQSTGALWRVNILISPDWHVNKAIAHFSQGWALPLIWLLVIKSLSSVLSQHSILSLKWVFQIAHYQEIWLQVTQLEFPPLGSCWNGWEWPQLSRSHKCSLSSKASCIESILLSDVLSRRCQTQLSGNYMPADRGWRGDTQGSLPPRRNF